MKSRVIVGLLAFVCIGCTSTVQYGETKTVVVRETHSELEKETVPGTVNEVWIEPMYNTVRVPAQLDPTGTFYIPSHVTVVEIRHGKFQKVQYPEQDGSYTTPRSK